MSDRFYITLAVVGCILLFLVLAVPIIWTQAHFEAQAWNELTGGNMTTWQAVWVEARVDCR